MKFYAFCNKHGCNLNVTHTRIASMTLLFKYTNPDTNWNFEIDLDSFECPVAKKMGQEGLHVGLAGAQYICRQDWVLEPFDNAPDLILVNRSALLEITGQLRGLAHRLAQIIKLPKEAR